MRPWFAAAIAVCAALVLATPSPAQSLAEIAARTKKKEKEEKDKSGKPAGKVYTESDLRGRPGSGSMSQMEGPVATASPAPGATAASGVVPPAGEKPKTEEEERAEKQTEWRERLQKAEADVARITEDINRAQNSLNDIRGPLYGGSRADTITRLEDSKRQLAAAQQTVVDLQEEGRRARYR